MTPMETGRCLSERPRIYGAPSHLRRAGRQRRRDPRLHRERRPSGQQGPGEGVCEVARVADRVDEQGAEGGGDRDPRCNEFPRARLGIGARAEARSDPSHSGEKRPDGDREQRQIDEHPDRPLLGGDRHRLVVGHRVVALLHVLLLGEGLGERSRPVAVEGTVFGEIDPAPDQGGAPLCLSIPTDSSESLPPRSPAVRRRQRRRPRERRSRSTGGSSGAPRTRRSRRAGR